MDTLSPNPPSSNIIYCNSKHKIWASWLFAVIWNALVWFAIVKGGDNILRAFQTNPIFYVFALFPFIGLWALVTAIRETLAWFKFGHIPLILQSFPARLNHPITGMIALPIELKQTPTAKLMLTCFHEYQDRSRSENQHQKEPLWQDSQSVQPECYGLETQIKFNFMAPGHLPISSAQGDDKYIWEILCHLPLSGLDFERTFVIPVLANNHHATEPNIEYLTTQQPPGLNLIASNIPKTTVLPAGMKFEYGYGRSKGMAIILLLVASFLSCFNYLFFKGFTDFLPLTTMLLQGCIYLMVGLLFGLAIFMVANKLMIEINLDGIKKQQKIFGYDLAEYIPTRDIADIAIEKSGSTTSGNQTRIWYSLKLHTKEGISKEVGDSLADYSHAQSIRQMMINALGRNWQASAVTNQVKTKLPLPTWLKKLSVLGKLLKYSVPLAIIYDLREFFVSIFKPLGW